MFKIGKIIRFIKTYAIHIFTISLSIYFAIFSHNILSNYNKYNYSENLMEYLNNKENNIPLVQHEDHKFINNILYIDNKLNNSENTKDILEQLNDSSYEHPFQNIHKFNILKELVIQNDLLSKSDMEKHTTIIDKRLMNLHKIFGIFNLNNQYVFFNNNDKNINILSMLVYLSNNNTIE